MSEPITGTPEELRQRLQRLKPGTGQHSRIKAKLAKLDQREREEERTAGTPDSEAQLLAALGDPPLDTVGNQRWANNAAAVMARITLRDTTIPREQRFKQAADYIDRIAATHVKADVAERLERVEGRLGVRGKTATPKAPEAEHASSEPRLPALRSRRAH